MSAQLQERHAILHGSPYRSSISGQAFWPRCGASYSLNNSQSQSQDNRKWIIHVLSVFALIVEAEPNIHPVSPTAYSLPPAVHLPKGC
jgi:hypothetical protein